MFKNYYKLLNISSNASNEEINNAIEQSRSPRALLEEIRMILQNKSLKPMYDEEVKIHESKESKNNNEITNPVLRREIKKIKVYLFDKLQTPDEVTRKPSKSISSKLWWIIGFLLFWGVMKGCSSYRVGQEIERAGQEWVNSY